MMRAPKHFGIRIRRERGNAKAVYEGHVWGRKNGVKVTEWVGQERIYSDILKRVRQKAKLFPGCRAGQRRLPKRKKPAKKQKKGVKSKSILKKNLKNEEVEVQIKIEIKEEETMQLMAAHADKEKEDNELPAFEVKVEESLNEEIGTIPWIDPEVEKLQKDLLKVTLELEEIKERRKLNGKDRVLFESYKAKVAERTRIQKQIQKFS